MFERESGPIKVEIVEHFGVLSTAPTGWTKEFNLVKWNDRPEKYDIRDWSPGHERMSKGVTLFDYEMKKIVELCSGFFDETPACDTASTISSDEKKQEAVNEVQVQQETAAGENCVSDSGIESADKVAEEEIPF